jgi:F-type H+-transporting ATPase subunit a
MPAIQPMEQFLVHKLIAIQPVHVGNFALDLSITNSTMMMFVAALTVCLILGLSSRGAVVPGRMQAVGEILYDLVDGILVGPIIGDKGRPYLPFILSIFMMILAMNLLGVVLAIGNVGGMRWTFTPTAQLAVTATLAVLTFVSVLVIGVMKNGLNMYKLFVPSGMPIFILPLIILIELISFFIRPLTLAMRLFGNMLGGHVVMYIFGSFVVMLGLIGATGGIATLGYLGSGLSFAMVIALTGLELVVAGLQAFVFAALATVYLSEVVNLGHGH